MKQACGPAGHLRSHVLPEGSKLSTNYTNYTNMEMSYDSTPGGVQALPRYITYETSNCGV
jgi:hypothetical protein